MKLDIVVCFEGGQFKVGQSEWEMMTFNEKHHLVSPLVPTACACAKLYEYLGKLRNSKIEVLQAQGDFGEIYQHGKRYGKKATIARYNGKSQGGNLRNGRSDSKYTLTSGKYYFRMFLR